MPAHPTPPRPASRQRRAGRPNDSRTARAESSADPDQAPGASGTDRLGAALLALVLLPHGLVAVLTHTAWTTCGRKWCVLASGPPALVFGLAVISGAAALGLLAADRLSPRRGPVRLVRRFCAGLAAVLGVLCFILLP